MSFNHSRSSNTSSDNPGYPLPIRPASQSASSGSVSSSLPREDHRTIDSGVEDSRSMSTRTLGWRERRAQGLNKARELRAEALSPEQDEISLRRSQLENKERISESSPDSPSFSEIFTSTFVHEDRYPDGDKVYRPPLLLPDIILQTSKAGQYVYPKRRRTRTPEVELGEPGRILQQSSRRELFDSSQSSEGGRPVNTYMKPRPRTTVARGEDARRSPSPGDASITLDYEWDSYNQEGSGGARKRKVTIRSKQTRERLAQQQEGTGNANQSDGEFSQDGTQIHSQEEDSDLTEPEESNGNTFDDSMPHDEFGRRNEEERSSGRRRREKLKSPLHESILRVQEMHGVSQNSTSTKDLIDLGSDNGRSSRADMHSREQTAKLRDSLRRDKESMTPQEYLQHLVARVGRPLSPPRSLSRQAPGSRSGSGSGQVPQAETEMMGNAEEDASDDGQERNSLPTASEIEYADRDYYRAGGLDDPVARPEDDESSAPPSPKYRELPRRINGISQSRLSDGFLKAEAAKRRHNGRGDDAFETPSLQATNSALGWRTKSTTPEPEPVPGRGAWRDGRSARGFPPPEKREISVVEGINNLYASGRRPLTDNDAPSSPDATRNTTIPMVDPLKESRPRSPDSPAVNFGLRRVSSRRDPQLEEDFFTNAERQSYRRTDGSSPIELSNHGTIVQHQRSSLEDTSTDNPESPLPQRRIKQLSMADRAKAIKEKLERQKIELGAGLLGSARATKENSRDFGYTDEVAHVEERATNGYAKHPSRTPRVLKQPTVQGGFVETPPAKPSRMDRSSEIFLGQAVSSSVSAAFSTDLDVDAKQVSIPSATKLPKRYPTAAGNTYTVTPGYLDRSPTLSEANPKDDTRSSVIIASPYDRARNVSLATPEHKNSRKNSNGASFSGKQEIQQAETITSLEFADDIRLGAGEESRTLNKLKANSTLRRSTWLHSSPKSDSVQVERNSLRHSQTERKSGFGLPSEMTFERELHGFSDVEDLEPSFELDPPIDHATLGSESEAEQSPLPDDANVVERMAPPSRSRQGHDHGGIETESKQAAGSESPVWKSGTRTKVSSPKRANHEPAANGTPLSAILQRIHDRKTRLQDVSLETSRSRSISGIDTSVESNGRTPYPNCDAGTSLQLERTEFHTARGASTPSRQLISSTPKEVDADGRGSLLPSRSPCDFALRSASETDSTNAATNRREHNRRESTTEVTEALIDDTQPIANFRKANISSRLPSDIYDRHNRDGASSNVAITEHKSVNSFGQNTHSFERSTKRTGLPVERSAIVYNKAKPDAPALLTTTTVEEQDVLPNKSPSIQDSLVESTSMQNSLVPGAIEDLSNLSSSCSGSSELKDTVLDAEERLMIARRNFLNGLSQLEQVQAQDLLGNHAKQAGLDSDIVSSLLVKQALSTSTDFKAWASLLVYFLLIATAVQLIVIYKLWQDQLVDFLDPFLSTRPPAWQIWSIHTFRKATKACERGFVPACWLWNPSREDVLSLSRQYLWIPV